MDRIFLTKEQAISALPKGKQVHTFLNPNGMLIGADWSKKSVLAEINKSDDNCLEIGGELCKGMKHALIIYRDNSPLFVETNMDVIEKLESSYV
jgi:hypothetical protein